MNFKSICLFFLYSFIATIAEAQMPSSELMNQLYGPVIADSAWLDLKANHVHTIEKIMNDGKDIMSATLDRNGRLIRFQYHQGYVADSMVYDHKDRLLQQYQLTPDGIIGYTEYLYNDSTIMATYYVDNKNHKKKTSSYTMQQIGDTGFVWQMMADGSSSITKSYTRRDTDYVLILEKDENGKEKSNRVFYTVYDIAYRKKYHQNRLLEEGELEYTEGLADAIEQLPEEDRINTNDEGMIQAVYLLYDKHTSDSMKREIVRKYFPALTQYEGVKHPSVIYQYDDSHHGRVIHYQNDQLISYYFEYNQLGRVVISKQQNSISNHTINWKYEYAANGLLQSFNAKDESETKYKYSFY